MSKPSERLAELGLQLPEVVTPLAAYVPARRVGDQIWTSGQLPMVNGRPWSTGRVGDGVHPDSATECARISALNALAAAASVAGGVDNITAVLKVTVYVASAAMFTAQPQVANGASQLFIDVFGDAGRHVRSAVGVAVLPLDSPVEVELVVQA